MVSTILCIFVSSYKNPPASGPSTTAIPIERIATPTVTKNGILNVLTKSPTAYASSDQKDTPTFR